MARLQIKDIAQRQNLNRYWNNKTKSVNLEALGKIARALGVSVRDLFTENEEEQSITSDF